MVLCHDPMTQRLHVSSEKAIAILIWTAGWLPLCQILCGHSLPGDLKTFQLTKNATTPIFWPRKQAWRDGFTCPRPQSHQEETDQWHPIYYLPAFWIPMFHCYQKKK